MFCTNCGAKIPDDSAFCSMCGSKQPVVEQPVQESTYSQPNYGQPNYGQAYYDQPSYSQTQELMKRKKSPLLPILIIAIALLVIGGGVLAYFAFFNGSKNDIAGKYNVVAINVLGYNVDPQLGDPDGNLSSTIEIDLNGDGTGTVSYDGNRNEIKWSLEGINMNITDMEGKPLKDFFDSVGGAVQYRDGRIWCVIDDGKGQATSTGALILAKEGDDLSDLDIKSGWEVMRKIFGSGPNSGGATEPETTVEPSPTVEPTPEPTDAWSDPGDTDPSGGDSGEVHPKLKKAVDEFEENADDFIAAFQEYSEDPMNNSDIYLEAMEKYSKLADKVSKIQEELIDKGEYNDADQAYISSIYIPLLNKLTEEMQAMAQ